MENWKFLLQKEGDRSWLPLDSPDVEILEGRYRIVARSNQKNVEVEVRISHLSLGEDPPKRRIQKRSNRTNQDGLMVVIPFTRLNPGIWELCCSSVDLMSDLLGDSWQYAVKLQVVAQEEAIEWEPDWSSQPDLATPEAPEVAVEPAAAPLLAALSTERVTSIAPTAEAASALETEPAITNSNAETELTESAPIAHPSELPVVASANQPSADSSPVEIEVSVSISTGSSELLPAADAPATSPEAAQLSPEVAEILGASMDRLFQIAEQMSNQLVDEVLRDFDLLSPLELLQNAELETFGQKAESASIQAQSVAASTASPTSEVSQSVPAAPLDGYRLTRGTAPCLKLDQEAFVAARGETLTLSGQVAIEALEVEATSEFSDPFDQSVQYFSSDSSDDADLWATDADPGGDEQPILQELQLYLRDPQSLQILVSDRHPLPEQAPPFPFSFSFCLPAAATSHLVLGEVLLCGFLPGRVGNLSTLTTQAFTITADAKELVGELTKVNEALDETLAECPAEEEDRIDLPFEVSNHLEEKEKEKELSLNLSFLDPDPTEADAADQPFRFASLAGQPLPPQIYRPDPDQIRDRAIELPNLTLPVKKIEAEAEAAALPVDAVQSDTASASPPDELQELFSLPEPVATAETVDSAVATETEALPSSQELVDPVLVPVPVDQPVLESVTVASVDAESVAEGAVAVEPDAQPEIEPSTTAAEAALEVSEEPEGEPSQIDLPSPIQMGFQALRLQDRFLTRLNSLATDAELSAWLRSQFEPVKAPVVESAASEPESSASPIAEAERVEHEIVVNDDEPLNIRDRRRSGSKYFRAEQPLDEDEPNVLILPKDEPIPMPRLEVVGGELTSGALVNLRVKLPNVLPRMYVKLWVTDRQSRSLLDGPRWLLDFLPNGLGDMEAFTQLTVPFGSLEIRFEAIAIEMHTQRESHKASVDRDVVPPDLPVMSLEDFEV